MTDEAAVKCAKNVLMDPHVAPFVMDKSKTARLIIDALVSEGHMVPAADLMKERSDVDSTLRELMTCAVHRDRAQARAEAAEARLGEAEELLRRIRQWDVLVGGLLRARAGQPHGDEPYWCSEIDAFLSGEITPDQEGN